MLANVIRDDALICYIGLKDKVKISLFADNTWGSGQKEEGRRHRVKLSEMSPYLSFYLCGLWLETPILRSRGGGVCHFIVFNFWQTYCHHHQIIFGFRKRFTPLQYQEQCFLLH